MSAIVLSGGRILGTGGGIFAVGGSSPPPPPVSSSNVVKFRSGMYMQSGNPNDQASMNAFSTSWAGNGGACQGYSAWYKWNLVETALGVYSFTSVFNDYAYLQSVAPGASFVPQFNWYANQMGLTPAELPSFNPSSDGVPNYILDNPSTYGAGPPTSSSSYGGWCCDSYESTAYNYVRAAYWRTLIQARIVALFNAFGSTIVPDGQGFTVDEHPLFEMVGTSTPTDLDMQAAPNIAADYTYELANQAWLNMLPSLRATMPHTGVFIMPGFGANNFSGGNDPTQQNTLIKAMLTNGIAQSCTDVYTPTQLTYAQNYLVGNNYNGSTGFQTPLLGQIDSTPSVQGDDYPLNAITEILNCSFVTLQASRVFLYSQSNANYNIPGFWNTIIGTINSYSIPTICGELPTMYMIAPQNFVAASTTASSVTLTWTPQTTQTGTNLVYKIYRNGSLINVTASTSVFTYTDSGLSANTAYTYAINVANTNGAGPQSTYVATTAVYSYPSGFASAHSAFNFPTSDAQSWSGSVALIGGGGTAGEHQAGALWYSTQLNISSGFTQTFTFTMPSIAQQEAAVGGGTPPNIIGASFTIQNIPYNGNASWVQPNGGWAFADSNMAGFGAFDLAGQYPMTQQVSVLFGMNNYSNIVYPPSGYPNYTGLYLNGGGKGQLLPFNDLNPYGIQFNDGNLLSCTVTYDNTLQILTMVLTDTVTGAQARQSWPVNIPAIIGGNNAWLGWTVGEIPAAPVTVNSASLWMGLNPRLSTPTFSVPSGPYASTQSVSISAPAGASIYYTTNGLAPSVQNGTLYTGTISVSSMTALQAVAIEAGYTDSLVAAAIYAIGSTSLPIVNYPSGFAANGGMTLNGIATLNGSAIELTSLAAVPTSGSWNGCAGSSWFPIPVNIQTFTANFQLEFTSASATGMTFCVQSQTPVSEQSGALYVTGGPNALGGTWTGLGYASPSGTGTDETGILSSVAVAFDLHTSPNSVGVYTNGALPTGSQTATGLTFNGGTFNVTLTYDGTNLSISMQSTSGGTIFTHSWTENIPSIVGGNLAYIGFTGGIGAETGNAANQFVNSFTFVQG